MLPRAHSGSTPFPPEEWLIRRVVSEREGLEQLRSALGVLETEPTSWFAPSRHVYVQRLQRVGEDLSRAIAATDSLVDQLRIERLRADIREREEEQRLAALAAGS
jgi:hypothetical protein